MSAVDRGAVAELCQEVDRRLNHNGPDWPRDQMASLLGRGHWGGNPHLLMLTVAAVLELGRNQNSIASPITKPTSGSICENGEPEKLARGIYERLQMGRSGLIWAVHWRDLPPEISRRWVEAVAGALAEQASGS